MAKTPNPKNAEAQEPTLQVVVAADRPAEDIFAETGEGVVAAAPTEPPAKEALPEGIVYIDFLEQYAVRGIKATFDTVEQAFEALNGSTIDSYVDQFMSHVLANPASYFMVEAKPATTSKKAKTLEDGTVVPAGTVTPATEARLMEGVALESAQTRLRKAARQVFAWVVRNPV